MRPIIALLVRQGFRQGLICLHIAEIWVMFGTSICCLARVAFLQRGSVRMAYHSVTAIYGHFSIAIPISAIIGLIVLRDAGTVYYAPFYFKYIGALLAALFGGFPTFFALAVEAKRSTSMSLFLWSFITMAVAGIFQWLSTNNPWMFIPALTILIPLLVIREYLRRKANRLVLRDKKEYDDRWKEHSDGKNQKFLKLMEKFKADWENEFGPPLKNIKMKLLDVIGVGLCSNSEPDVYDIEDEEYEDTCIHSEKEHDNRTLETLLEEHKKRERKKSYRLIRASSRSVNLPWNRKATL